MHVCVTAGKDIKLKRMLIYKLCFLSEASFCSKAVADKNGTLSHFALFSWRRAALWICCTLFSVYESELPVDLIFKIKQPTQPNSSSSSCSSEPDAPATEDRRPCSDLQLSEGHHEPLRLWLRPPSLSQRITRPVQLQAPPPFIQAPAPAGSGLRGWWRRAGEVLQPRGAEGEPGCLPRLLLLHPLPMHHVRRRRRPALEQEEPHGGGRRWRERVNRQPEEKRF